MSISRGIGLTLWLAVSSLTAQAEPVTVTGTLTLSGRLEAEPCRIELDDRQLSWTCTVAERTNHEQVSLSILQQGEPGMLTAALVDYHWVDPAHTMAIITISHD
jgi:type 1 fimbria pilin